MLDLLFLVIVIVFFALAVGVCPRLAFGLPVRPRARGAPVRVGDVVLLVLALGVLAYLVWALLAPERLG